MNKKTLIGLGVIATALFAFIVLYEKDTLTSVELETRENRLIERLVRTRVSRIELTRQGQESFVVERRKDTDEDAEEDIVESEWEAWQLVGHGEADQEAVNSLIGALEWADARRTLESITAEDRVTYGLDEPRVVAEFTVANEVLKLTIGGDATGGGVYMVIGNEPIAHVVGRDVFEALDHEPGHFRGKDVFASSQARATELSYGGVELKKEEGRWRVSTGPALASFTYASEGRVDEALRALDRLKARRFVSDAPEDVSAYGLAPPAITIRGDGPEGAFVLLVGQDCETEGEVHARKDEGPVVCVLRSDLGPFYRSDDDHRELRLLTIEDSQVGGLTLEVGDEKLEVTESEGRYRYELSGGSQVASGPVDQEALAAWLRSLRRMRATRAEVILDVLPQNAATLTVRPRDEERATEIVHLHPGSLDVFVLRGGETMAMIVPSEAMDLFRIDVTRFRSRELLEESAERVQKIQVQRGSVREVVERVAGWRVTSPVEVEAEPGTMRDLAEAFAKLRVVRFASGDLGDLRATVTVSFAEPEDDGHGHDHDHDHGDEAEPLPPSEHTLRIFGSTEGGAFARLDDDPAAFVIVDAVVSLLLRPIAKRDVFSSNADYLEGLEIAQGGTSVALTHDDADFRTADGAVPNEERTANLVRTIANLRAAMTTHYGSTRDVEGLAPPRARVTFSRHEDVSPRSIELLIGAPENAQDGARIHVRRSDLEVGYLMNASDVDALLSYEP